jgi:cytochrome d ubiquinol oxidase subunit I
MDVLTLSRIQFGATIAFHYLYPPLSIGLGLMLVIMEGAWLKTGNTLYHQMARFWTRVFALTFAIGVATGIVMEFEFGTNWAAYSRYVGDVFGSALAAEGIFAFFLESGFLAVLLFGWDKVSRKWHFFSTCMVCLGAHFSAVWIIVANSWMQTPAGYHIVIHDGGVSRGERERVVFAETETSGIRPRVAESRPVGGARRVAVAGGQRPYQRAGCGEEPAGQTGRI